MAKEEKFIIRIDDDYLVGFEGGKTIGKTSHNGWSQIYSDMKEIQLSMYRADAKILEGKINLKSALDKIYERMRYGEFSFDYLEVYRTDATNYRIR